MNPKTLTTGDIAKYCDVNLRTVIRWINAGRLEGYKLPGRGNNRVTPKAFITFLLENNMPVPDEFQAQANAQRLPKVLIVDDDEFMAASIKRVLHPLKLDCNVANDGFLAGNLLHRLQPALMTLDLSMPGLNGFEVLQFARQQQDYDNLKIIVISALGNKSLEQAKQLGADAVLSKPFQNDELITQVKQLLNIPSINRKVS